MSGHHSLHTRSFFPSRYASFYIFGHVCSAYGERADLFPDRAATNSDPTGSQRAEWLQIAEEVRLRQTGCGDQTFHESEASSPERACGPGREGWPARERRVPTARSHVRHCLCRARGAEKPCPACERRLGSSRPESALAAVDASVSWASGRPPYTCAGAPPARDDELTQR
jgi:hypothetical protein